MNCLESRLSGDGVGRRRGSQEELEDVEVHEEHGDGHAIVQLPVHLVLLHSVAQHEHSPAHHAHAAICPGLQIKALADARVQLHPPVEVVDQAACAARVTAAGRILSLRSRYAVTACLCIVLFLCLDA